MKVLHPGNEKCGEILKLYMSSRELKVPKLSSKAKIKAEKFMERLTPSLN